MFTHSLVRPSLVLSVLALLALGTTLHAQTTYISTNTTLNANNPITADAVIGYANANDFINRTNGTSPTIAFLSGGSVSGQVSVYNNSTINVSGGNVGNYLVANDSSIVNISGGNVSGGLYAQGSSAINLFGTGLSAVRIVVGNPTFRYYSLSGTLTDGTVLVNLFLAAQNGGASFTLNNAVPEPSSIALFLTLSVSGAGMFLHHSRRRK